MCPAVLVPDRVRTARQLRPEPAVGQERGGSGRPFAVRQRCKMLSLLPNYMMLAVFQAEECPLSHTRAFGFY